MMSPVTLLLILTAFGFPATIAFASARRGWQLPIALMAAVLGGFALKQVVGMLRGGEGFDPLLSLLTLVFVVVPALGGAGAGLAFASRRPLPPRPMPGWAMAAAVAFAVIAAAALWTL